MPLLGLGTWLCPEADAKNAVKAAIKSGYRHIDTAVAYRNEKAVGEAVAECVAEGIVSRADLFIVSKLWIADFAPEDVIPAVKASLSRLGLDYLDAYLIHGPIQISKESQTYPPKLEHVLGYSSDVILGVWRELEKAKAEGLIRSIGVSNFTALKIENLIAAGGSIPSINQVEMHPALAQPKLLAYSSKRGIVLTAYSPLGSPGRPDAVKKEGDAAPLEEECVLSIAKAHGKTPAQVLIRWCIQRGVVCIPKSTNPDRIAANGQVFDFELTADEMVAIDGLDRGSKGRLLSADWLLRPGETLEQYWDGEPETVATMD